MNRIRIPISDEVKKEYKDPVAFMDQTKFYPRRKQIRKRATIAGIIGLIILILAPIYYANGDLQNFPGQNGNTSKGNFGLLVMAIGLLLYSLYQLMTTNRRIVKERRVQLLWLYPDLKDEQVSDKDSPWPKIVIISIVAALLLVGMFFWIKSIVDLAST